MTGGPHLSASAGEGGRRGRAADGGAGPTRPEGLLGRARRAGEHGRRRSRGWATLAGPRPRAAAVAAGLVRALG
jgi:hypothetical protein